MKIIVAVMVGAISLQIARGADAPANSAAANPYAAWTMGPPAGEEFFPVAVWLQSPRNAERYRAAGINVYVALWNGPTEEQLSKLKTAGMRLVCEMNEVARKHLDDPTIIGWMHGDEPDNAQSLGDNKGYGPPIEPKRIVADYEKLRALDPSRPVMLNLGQGVAWDQWYGRGVRSNHQEDYLDYIKGGDIISFDIYPVAHADPAVSGKLDFVSKGVQRLVKWSDGQKIVWNCIECTHIQTPDKKATPAQVRTEVWMSLIHGSMGLIYFVHEWTPKFNEAALLDDPEMLRTVSAVNHQIQGLAPVLNTPTLPKGAQVACDVEGATVAFMAKQLRGDFYLFAVSMAGSRTKATFSTSHFTGESAVEVIDEGRKIPGRDGNFTDTFEPGQVHLYKIALARGR